MYQRTFKEIMYCEAIVIKYIPFEKHPYILQNNSFMLV